MTVRVCVVGCGAIGGLYAAHLAAAGEAEVWAYDVAAEHVAAIERDGLRITGHTELRARVRARTDAQDIPPCDFGIVATKGTFTEPAMAATAAVLHDAAVCSVQNGIGNEEVVARHAARVMRGVTLPAGRVTAPGVIHMDAPGPTWIGPFEPRPAPMTDVTALAGLLRAAGMEAVALADARGAQWTKLLFNASTNPLCALTRLTHGELCDLPATRRLVGALIAEGRSVADAQGIVLDADPDALVDEAARTNHQHKPSMLQDALAHRPTEVATLNGGIVAAARAHAVPTPLHAAIADLIAGLEHGWSR
jgi:2-dehydropantoate 2-reductase